MIKISVIIPNYNGEKYLKQCLNSVVSQTLKEIEIIVIDDGSTDNSIAIINEICHNNTNIKLIKQPNMNASVARNHGIIVSRGRYLFFLDSDDYLCDNYVLEKMYNDICGYDLLIGNYIEFKKKDNIIKKYRAYSDNLINTNSVLKYASFSPPPSNKLYKSEIIKQNQVYFSNVRIAQDLNFYLKYILVCKKVKIIDYNTYMYRIVENSMTRISNFNFMDIVNSFSEVKKYYKLKSKMGQYNKYISVIEFKHYCQQMSRVFSISEKSVRKIAYYYLDSAIKKINFDEIRKNKDFYKYYRKIIIFRVFHSIILSNTFIKIYNNISS